MVHRQQSGEAARFSAAHQFLRKLVLSVLATLAVAGLCYGQADTATVSGVITDPSGGVVAGAEVGVTNTDTNVTWNGISNGSGVYLVTGLRPGRYRLHVGKDGFKGIDLTDLILNVQDSVSRNFTLQVGSTSETVSVEGSGLQINAQDAAVSTVVDRQFAENLPMNGRSFQTLIHLTPGVVLTNTSSGLDSGQFSVNGQRASSNYWMVDGVSANLGSSTLFGGNGVGGAVGTSSVFGGTNSLVSVDALQEFRIETSTYAPEFGRTPGGQISIVTRSGTNQFHGALFDYLRNEVLDANDWFADSKGLPKPQERQNDFGGTISGPILRDKTFFFFSYEGLRLRLPQTALATVPDLNARQSAIPAMQPFLNAYPQPNGPDNVATGTAQFNRSYSNPATLDAYSLRIDHRLSNKLTIFGRYNYSPSEIAQRGSSGAALSVVSHSRIVTQTATMGSTWSISSRVINELRFNYSRTNASGALLFDSFGGAVPLTSLPFPSPFTINNGNLFLNILSLSGNPSLQAGRLVHNLQRQVNLVDSSSVQKGPHSLKFGADFRRLSPVYEPFLYRQIVFMQDVLSAENGNVRFSQLQSDAGTTLLLHNLGAFAEDTWRAMPRLSLTYGLRWDLDFAPSTANAPSFPAATGFNLANLSNLALAPTGTAAFKTTYGNVAPRFGVAYQLSQNPDWETVIRGGFGVFYDLATSELGNVLNNAGYPFLARSPRTFGGSFPLSSTAAAPPQIAPPSATSPGTLTAFDPNLKLPYTLEWSVALEQGLGKQQTLSASYVGAVGRRLMQSTFINSPSPSLTSAYLATNSATSDYHALQVQFQRRMSRGLQALASYTWSHSIDSASAGSNGTVSNDLVPGANQNSNRGPSDFDIRHAFSTGLTYDFPTLHGNSFTNAIFRGWSVESVIQALSAPPINIINTLWGTTLDGASTRVRPNVIAGIPFYLLRSQYPGGRAINNTPGAVAGGCPDGSQSVGPFCPPPKDASGKFVQGNLGRNALRGFGATQWDFAVHREFPIRERLRLQFRAEMFNVLNHPNFGQPDANLNDVTFGKSTQMLGQSLSGSLGAGGLSSLYQAGGPRSIQFALKLLF